jgi:hypothetical protein
MGRACLKEGLKGVKVRFRPKNMLGEGKVIQALIGVIVAKSPSHSNSSIGLSPDFAITLF